MLAFNYSICLFRHGREDLDVLGLSFRKDLYEDHIVLYPRGEGSAAAAAATATAADDAPKTKLQERLIRKLGAGAIPFVFQVAVASFSLFLLPDLISFG